MWDTSPFAAAITVPEAPTVVHPPAVSSSTKVLAGAKLAVPSYTAKAAACQAVSRCCQLVTWLVILARPRPQVSLVSLQNADAYRHHYQTEGSTSCLPVGGPRQRYP